MLLSQQYSENEQESGVLFPYLTAVSEDASDALLCGGRAGQDADHVRDHRRILVQQLPGGNGAHQDRP